MSPAASSLKKQPADDQPLYKLAHATAESAPKVPGRRSFFTYRDLGVAAASQGRIKAQTMTAVTMPAVRTRQTADGVTHGSG